MTLLLTLDDGTTARTLAEAVELARSAAVDEFGAEQVGRYIDTVAEDAVSASHRFEANVAGYRGWHWSVTVAVAAEGLPVTVSEMVLLPGADALVAQEWIPWERRVRAGDLGVGDVLRPDKNDFRIAPAYVESDDPAIAETAQEIGLGRVHVLSRYGRQEAAQRWWEGDFGPHAEMARNAPASCGTCGFYLHISGSLGGAFGVCANDIAPADGRVVSAEYGCGAHSEVEVESESPAAVNDVVYDDSLLDTD